MLGPVPTERELQALKVLWERGRATVREIWGQLSRTDQKLAYTTVLSLMQTMEQKGLVGHEPAGRAYRYFAKLERDGTFQRLVSAFIDKVFDGAMDEYLVHALNSCRPSPEELDQLEELIAEAREVSRQRQERGRGK